MKLENLQTLIIGSKSQGLTEVVSVLQRAGLNQLHWAEKARDALQRLDEYPTHLVFCDKQLGSVNGLALLKLLRQQERFKNLSFVFISESSNLENEIEQLQIAIAFGVTGYFLKPIDPIRFEESVKKIIGLVLNKK